MNTQQRLNQIKHNLNMINLTKMRYKNPKFVSENIIGHHRHFFQELKEQHQFEVLNQQAKKVVGFTLDEMFEQN